MPKIISLEEVTQVGTNADRQGNTLFDNSGMLLRMRFHTNFLTLYFFS